MEEKEKVGYIYILTNKALEGYVKIGYAADVEKRLCSLNTAVPSDFEVRATYQVSAARADKKLHDLIDMLNENLRVKADGKLRAKEFFTISCERACGMLRKIAEISDTIDKFQQYEQNKNELADEELANDVQKQRREHISLFKCGLKIGDKLEFLKRPNEIAIVKNAYEVEYNNETWRISPLATKLLGKESENSVSGSLYWTYNGETLQNIRDRREEEGTYQ